MDNARYGFLLEDDESHLGSLFPKVRAKTVIDLGLQGPSDDKIIASADKNLHTCRERRQCRKRPEFHGLLMVYGRAKSQALQGRISALEVLALAERSADG